MDIGKAWCDEMSNVVDIYKARWFFYTHRDRYSRLTFYCSDERCRQHAVDRVRVTGVNHLKFSEEDDYQVRPHFRMLDEHLDNGNDVCPWVVKHLAVKELEEEARRRKNNKVMAVVKRFKNIKSSDVIEVFNLETNTSDDSVGGIDSDDNGNIFDRIRGLERRGKIDTLKQHVRDNPNKTKRLFELVSCYLSLTFQERKENSIKIPGYNSFLYSEFFKPAKWFKDSYGKRVYFGNVRVVKKYLSRDGNYSFLLSFYDKAKEHETYTDYKISMYLKQSLFDKHELALNYNHLLFNAHENYRWLTCYFYADIAVSSRINHTLDILIYNFNQVHFTMQSPQPI